MLCIGSWRALGLAAGMVTACSAAWSTDRIAGLELVSPYQQYQVRLHVLLYPPTTAIGLLVKARINGGPLLRLLLDSGAENLVLDRKAAGRAGYRSGTDLDLLGPAAMIRRARLTSARSVAVDDLEFRNVPMVILEGGLVDGIDGVIPLSLFADFLIHLDGAGKTMVLDPYPSSDRSGVGEFVQAKAQHRLLFLRGLLEGRHDGYLLLDTGSSYNLISHSATDALRLVSGLARSVPLLAAAGKTDGRMLRGGISLRLGDRSMTLDPVLAMDLGEISKRNGFELAGVIGYPALARSCMTVDYKDSLVEIRPR